MKPIRFRAEAETELAAAAAWYEDRTAGLGADLIAEVDTMLDRIQAMPERFPAWVPGRPYRKARLLPVLQNPRRCRRDSRRRPREAPSGLLDTSLRLRIHRGSQKRRCCTRWWRPIGRPAASGRSSSSTPTRTPRWGLRGVGPEEWRGRRGHRKRFLRGRMVSTLAESGKGPRQLDVDRARHPRSRCPADPHDEAVQRRHPAPVGDAIDRRRRAADDARDGHIDQL